jgi:hypothetical protein
MLGQSLIWRRLVRLQIYEPDLKSHQMSLNLQKRLSLEKQDKKILKTYVDYNE